MRFAALMLIAGAVLAHDLQVTWQPSGQAIIVRSAYAGTESCVFASVQIFSPSNSKTEFQNARTDANGMFSFIPHQPGQWRIIIDDEIGHRVEKTIEWTGGPSATPGGAQPTWQKMITGVALIIGLTGFLYGWKARRTS